MKALFKIFTVLTRHQVRNCVLLVMMMLFGAVLETVGIGVLYPLIKVISDPDILVKHERIASVVERFGVTTHRGLIIFCSFGLILYYAFKNAYMITQTRLQLRFSANLQKLYVTRLFSLYLYKPYLYHVNVNSNILSRNSITYGSNIFTNILWNTLAMLTEIFIVIVVWCSLLVMNWMIAVFIAAVMGPLAIFVLKTFKRKLADQSRIQREAVVEQGKWVGQGLGSIKETKVMCTEKFFVRQFEVAYAKFVDTEFYSKFIATVPRSIVEMMGMGGILLLIIGAMILNANPVNLIPTLGVLAVAATRLMPSTNRIMSYFNTIKFNLPQLDDIYDDLMLLKRGEDAKERNAVKEITTKMPFEHEIVVQNLSFRYPNTDKNVLDNVSFKIPKGTFVGIIGPSGAGKTTFVDVMLGLLPPTSGHITVDGKDIYDDRSGWLANVAYVPQMVNVLDSSIRENITIGVKPSDIDEDRLERAMRMAEMWDYVQSLPMKDMTNTGQDGRHLSGGQRQRISIARALYRDPDVLVLDEATSALDNETEKCITETILRLKNSITIIAIAHRLSTLDSCDFKIRLDNGKATREG